MRRVQPLFCDRKDGSENECYFKAGCKRPWEKRRDGEKLTANAGQNGRLFGSVTSKEIAELIAKEFGIQVDKRKIVVEDIKNFGTFPAEIKLYNGVTAKLYVMVGE